ncbi:lanthionine synthetase LanC family protein [Mesorhizobium erdmanii]|uniref:lanthionine synthetase LanC family protein n=1 Tax=Mesorhizobium erdmanii TaxID=1777866 RepID=UPI0014957B05|nr:MULTISPECIES: lanthionine synthetase LanC family protein [Mesorhizobium]
MLRSLNAGSLGASQIGKFITVYPDSDSSAVEIAELLYLSTLEFNAPEVPSDLPVHPDGNVYYRYGTFINTSMQLPNGEIVSAFRAKDGSLTPDHRRPFYAAPDDVPCPFPNDLEARRRDEAHLISDRYLLLFQVSRTARGAVFMGHDIDSNVACVVKRARLRPNVFHSDSDPSKMLLAEHRMLGMLRGLNVFPKCYDLIESDHNLWLVMQYVDGLPLSEYVTSKFTREGPTITKEVLQTATAIARHVGTLHQKDFVYRDLKSSNILVCGNGNVDFVDAEHVYLLSEILDHTVGGGTRGYMSSRQLNTRIPSKRDDIYSLGAILYFIFTGAEPSRSPTPTDLLSRRLELMNSACPQGIIDLVTECLDPDGFPNLAASHVSSRLDDVQLPVKASPRNMADRSALASTCDPSLLANKLVKTLISRFNWLGDGQGFWESCHPLCVTSVARDIHVGVSGMVIALANALGNECFDRTLLRDATEVLLGACRWLTSTNKIVEGRLPGLYVGEMGVAYALCVAATELNNEEILRSAISIARDTSSMAHTSPDLFNGTAGRLRSLIRIWDVTGDAHLLKDAVSCGEIIASAALAKNGAFHAWKIPNGFGGLSNNTYLGYAHGAAGIADTLVELYLRTGDDRYISVADGAGEWLLQRMQLWKGPVAGAYWNSVEESAGAAPPYWCHGSAGIATFLMHLYEIHPEASLLKAMHLALNAVSEGSRWATPAYCHGLAGSIDVLLDAHTILHSDDYRRSAFEIATILETFRIESEDGVAVYTENPEVTTPDFMVGYSGLIGPLFRLAASKRAWSDDPMTSGRTRITPST